MLVILGSCGGVYYRSLRVYGAEFRNNRTGNSILCGNLALQACSKFQLNKHLADAETADAVYEAAQY